MGFTFWCHQTWLAMDNPQTQWRLSRENDLCSWSISNKPCFHYRRVDHFITWFGTCRPLFSQSCWSYNHEWEIFELTTTCIFVACSSQHVATSTAQKQCDCQRCWTKIWKLWVFNFRRADFGGHLIRCVLHREQTKEKLITGSIGQVPCQTEGCVNVFCSARLEAKGCSLWSSSQWMDHIYIHISLYIYINAYKCIYIYR